MSAPLATDGMCFHHVGVVTGHLEESAALYTSFGYSSSTIYSDPLQKARIILMRRGAEPMIELISPDAPDSPAASWLQRIRAGPYHTCYEVDDVETVRASLRGKGLFPVLGPVPAVAFDMRQVLFLWSKAIGLIEFLASSPR